MTGNIWLMTINAVPELTSEVISVIRGREWDLIGPAAEWWGVGDWAAWWWRRFEDDYLHPPADGEVWAAHILFLSTFFTSVWLWLHALAVIASRGLLRLNSGVGFLLRVTDVERQPFRSLGFVSVIIVSALFALGRPLVLV